MCAAVVAVPITVHAATTINVPANYPTIQEAIGAAVNSDTIVVAPGTYNELINFNGKAITVQSAQGGLRRLLGDCLSSGQHYKEPRGPAAPDRIPTVPIDNGWNRTSDQPAAAAIALSSSGVR